MNLKDMSIAEYNSVIIEAAEEFDRALKAIEKVNGLKWLYTYDRGGCEFVMPSLVLERKVDTSIGELTVILKVWAGGQGFPELKALLGVRARGRNEWASETSWSTSFPLPEPEEGKSVIPRVWDAALTLYSLATQY